MTVLYLRAAGPLQEAVSSPTVPVALTSPAQSSCPEPESPLPLLTGGSSSNLQQSKCQAGPAVLVQRLLRQCSYGLFERPDGTNQCLLKTLWTRSDAGVCRSPGSAAAHEWKKSLIQVWTLECVCSLCFSCVVYISFLDSCDSQSPVYLVQIWTLHFRLGFFFPIGGL